MTNRHRMTRRQRKAMEAAYARPAVRAMAARAIYVGKEELPKIALTFEMESGEFVKFELPLTEAAQLIEQATSAYHAAVPILKTARGGWGG